MKRRLLKKNSDNYMIDMIIFEKKSFVATLFL